MDLSCVMRAQPTEIQNVYTSSVTSNFVDGHAAHGGTVLSKICDAAKHYMILQHAALDQPHLLESTIHFIRPITQGTMVITLREMSIRKSSSTLGFSAAQSEAGAGVAVEGILVMGNLSPKPLHMISDWTRKSGPFGPPPVDLALLASDQDPAWCALAEIPFARNRVGMTHLQWHVPRVQQEEFVFDVWMRAPPGQRITQAVLIYLSAVTKLPLDDVYYPKLWENPSRASQYEKRYDAVITRLSCDVKALLPEDGVEWVHSRMEVRSLRNRRLDMIMTVRNVAGQVLMISNFMMAVHEFEQKSNASRSRI